MSAQLASLFDEEKNKNGIEPERLQHQLHERGSLRTAAHEQTATSAGALASEEALPMAYPYSSAPPQEQIETPALTTMPQPSTMLRRSLQTNDSGLDGPIWVLIVVCILFCCIWTPIICQRHCRRSNRRRAESQAEEIIRASLGNLNILASLEQRATAAALDASADTHSFFGAGAFRWSPDDRREFIQNVLVSRRIMEISSISKSTPAATEDDKEDPTEVTKPVATQMPMMQYNMILSDVGDPKEITKYVAVEPCAICLTDYEKDDILCWSQSEKCTHVFHRDCMEEWLLKHEECPCCRHNYLSLGGEDDEVDENNNNDNNNNNNNGGNNNNRGRTARRRNRETSTADAERQPQSTSEAPDATDLEIRRRARSDRSLGARRNSNRVLHSTALWLGQAQNNQNRSTGIIRTTHIPTVISPHLGGLSSSSRALNGRRSANASTRRIQLHNDDDADDDDRATDMHQLQIVALLSQLGQLARQTSEGSERHMEAPAIELQTTTTTTTTASEVSTPMEDALSETQSSQDDGGTAKDPQEPDASNDSPSEASPQQHDDLEELDIDIDGTITITPVGSTVENEQDDSARNDDDDGKDDGEKEKEQNDDVHTDE